MINRDDLTDFNIEYDRMTSLYIKSYTELTPDIESIGSYSSLLLNTYIYREDQLRELVIDIEDCLYVLSEEMFIDDYNNFVLDFGELLDNLINYHLVLDNFEICNNIKCFDDKLGTRLIG